MESKDPLIPKSKVDGLTPFKSFIFGIGHFMNDLSSADWFNYGMFYLIYVQQVDTLTAGMVFLVGQMADSFMTPLIGYLSDRFETRIGKRTPWYIFGTIFMPICHSFMYQDCYACRGLEGQSYLIVEIIWYCTFTALDNMGFACLQISHMSMIPALTPSKEKKDLLISLRNSFTFIANIFLLLIAMLIFNLVEDGKAQFFTLILTILSIGMAFNIAYLIFINEVKLCKIASEGYRLLNNSSGQQRELSPRSASEKEKTNKISWIDWLKKPQIYWIAMVYNMARLTNNYMTSMISFYLVYVIQIEHMAEDVTRTPWQLALVPLVLYISSALSSFIHAKIHFWSRRTLYQIGCGLLVIVSVFMYLLQAEQKYWIVPIVFVAGFAFSFELNSSMGIASAFIGKDADSGAVVWGMLGFLDKITSGVTVFLVTYLGNLKDSDYTRTVTSLILLITGLVGGSCALFIDKIQEYSEEEKQVEKDNY